MAKTLVLEWDSREARVIAIAQKGRKWSIEEAFTVSLPARDASAGDKVVGPLLKEALAQRGLGGAKCRIVVGRTSIELRYLTVPQAPSEELPDLVRFQALRQFSQLGEEWPLDFVPVSDSGETLQVLAASIVPNALDGLVDVCTTAGLTAENVYLRPFAAAANVAGEAVAEGQERRLIVDVLSEEADLVVVDRGRPIFCRTIKLPTVEGTDEGAAEARHTVLVGEIRRTVAAAQNQIPGAEISHISLFGLRAENEAVLSRLSQAHFTAETIDPFAETDPARLTELSPAQRGSFAPLVGVVHLLSGASTPSIDFLNPRQRPLPPDNRRRNVLAAAAGVMLLLAGATGYFLWSSGIDARLEELQNEITKVKNEVKSYQDVQVAATAVDNFEKTNLSVVEKLAQVSDKLPPGDRVLLTSLSITNPQIVVSRNKVTELPGSILVQGGAKELADRTETEEKLGLLGPLRSLNVPEGFTKNPNYAFQFSDQISIEIPKPPKTGAKAGAKSGPQANAKPGANPTPPAAAKPAAPPAASPAKSAK